jgi:hypothetical protein
VRLLAAFLILIGVLMIGQWSVSLAAGQVPEVSTEPIRLGFHLAAEFTTALALSVSGWALLAGRLWGRDLGLVALGILVYSLIVSPGYFAQQGQWAPVMMFAVLLIASLVCIRTLLRARS